VLLGPRRSGRRLGFDLCALIELLEEIDELNEAVDCESVGRAE